MAKKIVDVGSTFKRLKDTGAHFKRVDPNEVALALGVQERISFVDMPGNALSLFALRQDLARKLHSTGGRPALEGAKRRQKIPLTDEAWTRLEQLAETLTQEGRRTTPGQVASVLLLRALQQVESQALLSFSDIEKELSKGQTRIPPGRSRV